LAPEVVDAPDLSPTPDVEASSNASQTPSPASSTPAVAVDRLYIVRDVVPTYSLISVPAFAAGYLYTPATPTDAKAATNIKNLMMMHFSDKMLSPIFESWKKIVPQVLPKRTPSGRPSARRISYF
jgi:hypothetical protein